MHVRADVPIGAYLSGGLDSSLISILASGQTDEIQHLFHGRFAQPEYDESRFAKAAAQAAGGQLHQIEIGAADFRDNIEKVIYHLDYPVAGPGAFPQFMVSRLAREYLPWAALAPLAGVWCFQLDGIFIGATRTAAMRNAMLMSLAIFLVAWWVLVPYRNHGLWAALYIHYIARTATLLVYFPGLVRSVHA